MERRASLETIFWEVEKRTQRNGKPAQGRFVELTVIVQSFIWLWQTYNRGILLVESRQILCILIYYENYWSFEATLSKLWGKNNGSEFQRVFLYKFLSLFWKHGKGIDLVFQDILWIHQWKPKENARLYLVNTNKLLWTFCWVCKQAHCDILYLFLFLFLMYHCQMHVIMASLWSVRKLHVYFIAVISKYNIITNMLFHER